MHKRFPMTRNGLNAMKQELEQLQGFERVRIAEAIAKARAHGDLSENSEYDAAKEEQGLLEARIAELSGRLSQAEVIDMAKQNKNTILFGASVTLMDLDNEKEVRYIIASDYEADKFKHKSKNTIISIFSPMARAMLNKQVGDEIEVVTPRGNRYYEVIGIEYSELATV